MESRKVTMTRLSVRKKSRISLYLFILGAATQLFYKTVGKAFRIVYIARWMEYAINGICLFLLFYICLFLLFYICLAGVFVENVVLGIRNKAKVKEMISMIRGEVADDEVRKKSNSKEQ